MNSLDIISNFYPEDTPLRRLLLEHSIQVRDKALALADGYTGPGKLDLTLVSDGALLHDIGIGQCHAPSILCEGSKPYIAHGTIGAELLREYGRQTGLELEPLARICERHTGAGLTAEEIRRQALPITPVNLLPETPEEKLVCLADKYFSKSGNRQEKSLQAVIKSLAKFGPETLARFAEMCRLFGIISPAVPD